MTNIKIVKRIKKIGIKTAETLCFDQYTNYNQHSYDCVIFAQYRTHINVVFEKVKNV